LIPRRKAWLAIAALAAGLPALAAGVDSGVIRLSPRTIEEPPEDVHVEEPRRAFDFDSFQSRLEALWFQRKTFLANGRADEGEEQLERIRQFAAQEGIERLDALAGALLVEAGRHLDEGNHERALVALDHAAAFDPGRPEVYRARAAARWEIGSSTPGAVADLGRAYAAALSASVAELSLFHQITFAAILAVCGTLVVFSLFALARYQRPFRHEIEEWLGPQLERPWPSLLGWLVVLAPVVTWLAAAWAPLWWIAITFRFMRRSERVAAGVLLVMAALLVPASRLGAALYGTSADPAVRTTVVSADGSYDPDRIVELRSLVEAHPEDPVYRFLLARLYKNGRYLQEAFTEYKKALEIDPSMIEAHTNIGNIFFTTGQYPEAIANYRRTIEIDPDSFLAWFNLHLAQSEAFRFEAAKASLERARALDAERVARLLSRESETGAPPTVQDEKLEAVSVWEAALTERRLRRSEAARDDGAASAQLAGGGVLVPTVLVPLAVLVGCLVLAGAARRTPARACIRCGRPFCQYCKSGREAREYCSQCVHLFVLGDGLAPANKNRKLYEVARHEKHTRRVGSLASTFLPGANHLLRGRAYVGIVLVFLWLVGLVAWRPGLVVACAALVGLDLPAESLDVPSVPAAFAVHPIQLLALPVLPAVWIAGNAWRFKRREG
jgi:tetratricopeptide (TPR) repeat protein